MFEHFNFESLKSAGELLLMALAAAMVVLIWRLKEVFVTKAHFHEYLKKHLEDHEHIEDRHKETEKRLEDGAEKFATILADLDHLPNHKDISDLKDRIGAVEGSVKALGATINGLKDVIERIERPLNILVEHHMGTGDRR
jgi:predicted  nucleic acid-binding Zn-ribbon protein